MWWSVILRLSAPPAGANRASTDAGEEACFLLADTVDRAAAVDVDDPGVSDPVHRIAAVNVDHPVASDAVDGIAAVDVYPTSHVAIFPYADLWTTLARRPRLVSAHKALGVRATVANPSMPVGKESKASTATLAQRIGRFDRP